LPALSRPRRRGGARAPRHRSPVPGLASGSGQWRSQFEVPVTTIL
jgi:hypothetical protein